MMRLKDRVAIVVGAGALADGIGNGRASAIAYAREGASVLCVDREMDRAEATVAQILAEGGVARAHQADATVGDDVERAVKTAVEAWDRLDIMHNNVGVGGQSGDPTTVSEAGWDFEMAVNLKTAFLGTKFAVPVMEAQGGGVITNISSTLAVRFLRAPTVAYSVAKAGVETLTHACSLYYGPKNIRVNAIRIGFSETPLVVEGLKSRVPDPAQQERAMEKSRSIVPMGRHGDAWDVGAAAVFLASDEAKYISGVVLDVDGALKNSKL